MPPHLLKGQHGKDHRDWLRTVPMVALLLLTGCNIGDNDQAPAVSGPFQPACAIFCWLTVFAVKTEGATLP